MARIMKTLLLHNGATPKDTLLLTLNEDNDLASYHQADKYGIRSM